MDVIFKSIFFVDNSNIIKQKSILKFLFLLVISTTNGQPCTSKNKGDWIRGLRENASRVKHALSQKLKNELRVIPNLAFYLDDSLDYIEKIESSLKDGENPIKE